MQAFAPSIFQFCNANIQGEVKYNVGFEICIHKSCTHSAQASLNLTLGQQMCLNVALYINGAFQKKVNECEVFIKCHNWYMNGISKVKKKGGERCSKFTWSKIYVIILIQLLYQIMNSQIGVTTIYYHFLFYIPDTFSHFPTLLFPGGCTIWNWQQLFWFMV